VDGLVLAGTIYPNFVRLIQSHRVPYVMFGNNLFGPMHMLKYDQVGFDGKSAEFEATQHVIGQGHREILFVAEGNFPWFRRRYDGFCRAMKSAGLDPLFLNLSGGGGSGDHTEWATRQILEMKPRPTSIMAGNDEIAYGLWRFFRKLGVNLPDDISLVGFDDRDVAMLMDPPLTTVRVQKEAIGETLMKMLMEKLHQPAKKFAKQMIPTQLVVRGTVKHLSAKSHPTPRLAHLART